MLPDHAPLGHHHIRPDPGLGMDHGPVPDLHPGADHRIILDAAVVADERPVIDDTPAGRAVPAESHLVAEVGGENLCLPLDGTVFSDARVRADQDIILDGGIENPLNFQDVFIHSPALFHHAFSSIFSFKEKRGGEDFL